jgi:hypothetical protein
MAAELYDIGQKLIGIQGGTEGGYRTPFIFHTSKFSLAKGGFLVSCPMDDGVLGTRGCPRHASSSSGLQLRGRTVEIPRSDFNR